MPSPKAKGLEELFTDTLKDIYFAEKQILSRFAQNGQERLFAGAEPGFRKAS